MTPPDLMQPTRIQKLFERTKKENRAALIAYVTAGDLFARSALLENRRGAGTRRRST